MMGNALFLHIILHFHFDLTEKNYIKISHFQKLMTLFSEIDDIQANGVNIELIVLSCIQSGTKIYKPTNSPLTGHDHWKIKCMTLVNPTQDRLNVLSQNKPDKNLISVLSQDRSPL